MKDGRISALELCRTEQDENGKWVCKPATWCFGRGKGLAVNLRPCAHTD